MSEKLAEIPKIRELLERRKQLAQLIEACKHPIRSFTLRMIGVDTKSIVEMETELLKLDQQISDIVSIPDRFNDIFGEHGWILHEYMDLEVAKSAVVRAEDGDINGAEESLVEYYSPENVEKLLWSFNAIRAYQVRKHIVTKALEDYRDERYHACVPVVLAMLDGLIHDVHVSKKGLFVGQGQDPEIEAYNSFSAHSAGFAKLVPILRKSRYTTSTERVTLPYRNGILHGIDLGYDNKIVAAKTWAAFLSIQDYAIKAEKGELRAPAELPQKTLAERMQSVRDLKKFKRDISEWSPRSIIIGQNIPVTGIPDNYAEASPERKVVEFLHWWREQNFGFMAQCLQPQKWDQKQSIVQMKSRFHEYKLKEFEIVGVVDKGPAFSEISVSVLSVDRGSEVRIKYLFRVIYEDSENRPKVRGQIGGNWYVVNWQEL